MSGASPKSSCLLQKEQRNVSRFLVILIIASISGFVTWIFSTHGIWQQWTYLLHTITGFWLAILSCQYIINHVQLTQGVRSPSQASVGWTALLALVTVIASGSVIGLFGQYESQQWIYKIHLISSIVIVLLISLHIFFYRWIFRRLSKTHHNDRATGFSRAINRQLAVKIGLFLLLSIISISTLTFLYNLRISSYEDIAAVPFTDTYKEDIFFPSQAKTSTGTFLDARRIGRSEKCGECHQQITEEWRSSMHGRSASDPFFQHNLLSLASSKGIEASRYCGGCHIPIALLSGELSEGGTLDNGIHITEGVSCMACHGISEAVSLEGVGSYLYKPELHYLFGDSDDYLLTKLHNYLMKINPRQHRKDMARDILRDPRHCATCHEQYIDKELNDWGWIKLQKQYQAWIKGPFSRHSDKSYANDKIYRCQDCHFPLVKGDDPSANGDGKIRSHRSPAANTAVPYVLNDKEQLDTVVKFLQDNRISVTVQLAGNHNDKSIIRSGDEIKLNVSVASNRIGHDFPAGTVDINEPWIEMVVTDANGKLVYTSGLIDEDNKVDPTARFYFSSLVNRQGQRVWRHDLFNAVGESYVKLIPPGSADIQVYHFTVPSWAKGPLNAQATLRYRKFNHDYSSWALGDDSVRLPVVDMASDELGISISDIDH